MPAKKKATRRKPVEPRRWSPSLTVTKRLDAAEKDAAFYRGRVGVLEVVVADLQQKLAESGETRQRETARAVELADKYSQAVQALGLLSTLAGPVVVDIDNPLKMAQEIEAFVSGRSAVVLAEAPGLRHTPQADPLETLGEPGDARRFMREVRP